MRPNEELVQMRDSGMLTHWSRDKMAAIRSFPDNIFKRIFLNENVWILLKISLNITEN